MSEDAQSTTAESRVELEDLLLDLDREPLDLVEAIRWERSRRTSAPDLERDLARVELRFLESRARTGRYGEGVQSQVRVLQDAWLDDELETLRGSDGPAALFDLVELRAEFLQAERAAEATACERLIERRLADLGGLDDELREEARERYAAMASGEEDLELDHRVLLLSETAELFAKLGRRFSDREMARLARRLRAVAGDRGLASRLESVLTPRGALVLENLSLFLLFAVFGLLFAESMLPEGDPALRWLRIIDGSICLFFIAEFLFKVSLAPLRASWFTRNFFIDLLPAIPAALLLVDLSPAAGVEDAVALRALRLFRLVWFARYIQALRPALRMVRLVLFFIRGMDSLVRRFSAVLNRNFVFFEEAVLPLGAGGYGPTSADERSLLFRALRREHVLIADLPVAEATPLLEERARELGDRLVASAAAPRAPSSGVAARSGLPRDIPVEHAIEFLHRLQPEQLGMWLPRNDILALDRLVRILNAPLVRSLPIIRWFRSPRPMPSASEEARVVDFGRRVALVLERWRERILFVADMHGIVTGPQVLDRVASAMVKASKRPAVRLLMFGVLFLLLRALLSADNPIGLFIGRFLGTPLMVIGSVCLLIFGLGLWLKRLAGEAADTFKLTSEAHFLGLLELQKRRHQDLDLEFLGRRVFRWDLPAYEAAGYLAQSVRTARTGRSSQSVQAPDWLREEVDRVGLLYLHFLDGAVLHESDIKTNEQLLANLSLENIRTVHLRMGRREKKRLRRLSLVDGSLFRGPYVWFRFITESIAVEAAKRITDYNRHCLTLEQRGAADRVERNKFAAWLRGKRREDFGRLHTVAEPGVGALYKTTEFSALDFLTTEPEREQRIRRIFGGGVLQVLRRDRERMIREIFGTRPLHQVPASQRTVNFYGFYQARLSGGRFFLLPLHTLGLFLRACRNFTQKTTQIVREILAPERAAAQRERGRAPFAVALRKIHRMKAPNLLEAMQLRTAFDPSYCGAPPGWSGERGFELPSELDADMDFLLLRERDREQLEDLAATNRRRVQELHHLMARSPLLGGADEDAERRRRGERAVTIAYMTDRDRIRTLFRAAQWFEQLLPEIESRETRIGGYLTRRAWAWLLRRGRRHPVERWLRTHQPERRVSRRGRANLRRLWASGDRRLRETVEVWSGLSVDQAPAEEAWRRSERIYATAEDTGRELAALRAVQTLSVLDVRNYRELVFRLGGYAAEGEDPALAEALP